MEYLKKSLLKFFLNIYLSKGYKITYKTYSNLKKNNPNKYTSHCKPGFVTLLIWLSI